MLDANGKMLACNKLGGTKCSDCQDYHDKRYSANDDNGFCIWDPNAGNCKTKIWAINNNKNFDEHCFGNFVIFLQYCLLYKLIVLYEILKILFKNY